MMFKGRSIDEAVESVYDSFMKLWQKGKMWPFSKQTFARHMIIWIIMHFFIFSKVWMLPLKQFMLWEVLQESVTWLLNIGGSKRGGNKESIQSWTGVRQECPISPLLFIIVFDILLVSLKKEYNPQIYQALWMTWGWCFRKLNHQFSHSNLKKYEEVTGAKLNFNKCFVLSTESFNL